MAANTVLNYLPRKSVVHELTGTTKLAFFLLFTFASMITYNTWVLLFDCIGGSLLSRFFLRGRRHTFQR